MRLPPFPGCTREQRKKGTENGRNGNEELETTRAYSIGFCLTLQDFRNKEERGYNGR